MAIVPVIGTIAKVVLYRYYRLFSFQGIGNATFHGFPVVGLTAIQSTDFSRVSGNSMQLNCMIGAIGCHPLTLNPSSGTSLIIGNHPLTLNPSSGIPHARAINYMIRLSSPFVNEK